MRDIIISTVSQILLWA